MIIAAAVKYRGVVFTGYRHDRVYTSFPMGFFKGPEGTKDHIQGFITDKGIFLDRKEGGEYAFKIGQIKKETDLLFSEDLWTNEFGEQRNHPWDEGNWKFWK